MTLKAFALGEWDYKTDVKFTKSQIFPISKKFLKYPISKKFLQYPQNIMNTQTWNSLPAKIPDHKSPAKTTRSQDSLILRIPPHLENLLPVHNQPAGQEEIINSNMHN